MSSYAYEVCTTASRRGGPAQRAADPLLPRAMARKPAEPKRRLALLAAISLMTAALSFGGALLGLFPAGAPPQAALKGAAARAEPQSRGDQRVEVQVTWATTLSVHVRTAVGVYGASATFTGRASAGPEGSR